MGHKDLPQALVLLNEMNNSAQHVATLVDNMIQKVRKGELTTDQGLSFLEMKYNMLLSYLINLTYVVLRKCSGEKIEGDPCIDRLVEIRTVLEKIKPINNKLKYQIDKLVKTAITGTDLNDPANFKANPSNLLDNEEESSDESEDGDRKVEEKKKTGIYVPPKLSAVHYTGKSLGLQRCVGFYILFRLLPRGHNRRTRKEKSRTQQKAGFIILNHARFEGGVFRHAHWSFTE